jgi:peptidyl-prolyl cis-trans isomerase C
MIARLTLTLALVAAVPQPANDAVVATAGSIRITAGDVRQIILARRLTGDPQQLLSTMTVDGRANIAQGLAETALFAQEARRLALDQDPEVQRAIRWTVDRLLTEELTRRELAGVDTGEAALRAFHRAHENDFRTRARVKARHILVKSREEAEAARAEVAAGASFEAVASARNTDPTRERGGDLGWVPRGVMVKAFEEALFTLKAGQMSPVIQTSFGFHVIRAEEVDPGQVQPFEVVRDDVKRRVLDARLETVKARLIGPTAVTINRDALGALGK